MSTVHANGVDLYYEREGTGPRLLFVNGSGTTVEKFRPLFAPFISVFDLLVYDHRGLGHSGPIAGSYGMSDCADDALAVMDAVGWDSACVLGISFGGMVALEVAVTAPKRVERLALLCTSSGGQGGSSYPLHELEELIADEHSQVRRRLIDTRFDPEWLAAHPRDVRLVEMIEAGASEPDPARERGEREQLNARRFHDVWDRLSAISCPTYVGCGRYDGIAPPSNSAALASRIAGAELHEYEGGHAFFAQDPRSIPELIEYLSHP